MYGVSLNGPPIRNTRTSVLQSNTTLRCWKARLGSVELNKLAHEPPNTPNGRPGDLVFGIWYLSGILEKLRIVLGSGIICASLREYCPSAASHGLLKMPGPETPFVQKH